MSFPVPPFARRFLAGAALVLSLLLLSSASASAAVLDLENLDGPTAVEMMENGELTSVELTQAYIDRINALNQTGPGLNAVSQLNKAALAEAQKTDELRAEGKILSPAMGLPILLKDLIDVQGMYTSAGNWSLRDSYPETDSGVATKLKEHGVVILGKLGLSEYANYFGRQASGFGNLTGQVLNGLDTDQTPSGSSSGSGTAGAAALSMLTIGTETSGSITSPSRTQGLVGIRPTIGLVPGYGIAPIVASQDTAGPMDRTVANAALTLTSIAGSNSVNDAYYEDYWGELELEPEDIAPPVPNPLPDYLSALDPQFVKGKRIGYTGSNPEVLAAKQALEDAGAILVERPAISTPAMPTIAGDWYIEMHMAIDHYYERLGAAAPINSLAEEVADNEANAHEALKYGNFRHKESSEWEYGPGTANSKEVSEKLPVRKEIAQNGIELMLENGTPGTPADDFIAIIGSNNSSPIANGPLAGYPVITVPMGYSATQRRAIGVSIGGGAYSERDLIGVAYVLEQQTMERKPASEVNPSMYRCADTVPAPAFAERGDCNPDHDTALAAAGGAVPDIDFSLETTSATELQEMMEAGELTAAELTKAYLARIAVSNAAGPAIQAVRNINANAVAEAEALDAEREKSGPRGPLHGIPVLLNDGIDAKGLASEGGSIALQDAMPEDNSRIVSKLKGAGAIVLGTANVTELGAMVSDDMTDGYSSLGGQVLMPSDTDDAPAGSSAGAAAAVSSGMAAMAVGVETSQASAELIGPAGVNGVVGLKPTVGRVSRAGVMPVAKSQDSPGPIAQTVTDVAAQLQVIAGKDVNDAATTSAPAVPDYLAGLDEGALSGLGIATITHSTSNPETVKPVYDAAIATVTGKGATTTNVATPNPTLPDITTDEFGRDLDAYLAGLSGGADSLDEIVAYNKANPVEGLKFQQGDLLEAAAVDLTDPTQKTAYEGELASSKEGAKTALDAILASNDLIMVPSESSLVDLADKAGYPVLSVFGGYGLESMGRNPVGVAFIAAPFEEAELLAAGYAFEAASSERLAPSWTNPSMYRCVELSEFYSPHHCRPGLVEPLVVVPPTDGPPSPPPAAGTPKLTVKAVPKSRIVGAARKTVTFRLVARNGGDAATGTVSLCAAAPKARVTVLGKKCTTVEIPAGASKTRSVQLKIKPKAVGKSTKVTLTASGITVGKQSVKATLTVKD
ncbi:MAG TPA: amidase family protein [Solirubrobacterales bacterium]|nr:amidase family protein [Solirubrobacterales bacterium]